jgi:hypothetical protein
VPRVKALLDAFYRPLIDAGYSPHPNPPPLAGEGADTARAYNPPALAREFRVGAEAA